MDKCTGAPLWTWVAVGVVASLFIAGGVVYRDYQNRPAAALTYPLCADARDQKIAATTIIRVRPDCWSGWVKLTPGTEFDLLFSDETELFYRGGGRRTLPKSVGSLGHTPSTFSIRGKGGTVTVRLHDE